MSILYELLSQKTQDIYGNGRTATFRTAKPNLINNLGYNYHVQGYIHVPSTTWKWNPILTLHPFQFGVRGANVIKFEITQ